MTQITRKSVPMRGLILLLAMFLGAGLVLSGCGDDDTATTPAPAPPPPPPPAPAPEPEPEPEPPAPEAPATPTGLHVDETTETSVEYHWNEVEGATAYPVQYSMNETFGDEDDMADIALENHYTVTGLAPDTAVYFRVAAAAGTSAEDAVVSAYSTHVTGMSNRPPPPPPPPPAPDVMVMFSLSDDAKSPHYMIADDDDDEASAEASVNTEIMVESNSSAIITPTWMEGANGVSVDMGMNMPFAYVSWSMLQSMVLSDGATFMVQRTTVGANQEMEPTGDVAYVTCGPFECVDGMDVPMLSIENSGVCTAWDPMVEIQVGKVDNDVIAPDSGEIDDDGVNTNDGIDLGIVTSSNLKMSVKSVFSGVAGGTNTSASVEAASGSNKTLGMKAVGLGTGAVITVDADEDDATTEGIDESMVCDNTYTEEDVSTKADRPAGCFRLIGPGAMGRDAAKGPNYLDGWSIELSPLGGDVTWGSVDWKDDPFEDLTCGGADPIMVADHVDVCDMFDAEVSLATGKGWKPEVVFDTDNRVVMWRAGASAGSGERMFKTVWFDDNLNGKIAKDGTSASNPRPEPTTGNPANDMHDLYNDNENAGNIDKIWEFLTDSDGDLIDAVGDLGKADLVSDTDNPTTADDEMTIGVEACAAGVKWNGRIADHKTTGCGGTDGTDGQAATVVDSDARATHPDGNADNYVNAADSRAFSDFRSCSEDDGGDDADGSECDATWMHDVTVLFADGTFGCTTTRDVTITCTWDADGGMAQGRNALPDSFIGQGTTSNLGNFLKCSAK